MVQPLKGTDRILLFRVLAEAGAEVAASRLVYQTEHEVDRSRTVDSIPTKDGAIQNLGEMEVSLSVKSIQAKGDEFLPELEVAFEDGKVIEVWDIDTSGEGTLGKFPSTYYQGYITSMPIATNAEDNVEVSIELAINGSGKRGDATLDEAQTSAVYEFKDTVAAD